MFHLSFEIIVFETYISIEILIDKFLSFSTQSNVLIACYKININIKIKREEEKKIKWENNLFVWSHVINL